MCEANEFARRRTYKYGRKFRNYTRMRILQYITPFRFQVLLLLAAFFSSLACCCCFFSFNYSFASALYICALCSYFIHCAVWFFSLTRFVCMQIVHKIVVYFLNSCLSVYCTLLYTIIMNLHTILSLSHCRAHTRIQSRAFLLFFAFSFICLL